METLKQLLPNAGADEIRHLKPPVDPSSLAHRDLLVSTSDERGRNFGGSPDYRLSPNS